jgi:MFS transporter, ACS family, pantothenate transporter
VSKNVLLIGASISSTDIAKELGPFAKKIYQSSRGGIFDLPAAMLPENAARVGEVISFNQSLCPMSRSLEADLPMTGTITLADGAILENIDRILICTGYHFSLPFLREYHRDFLTPESADDTTLVTNGEQVHNLHKDIFYIPDPTLSFIGVPFYVATFTLFEFQAIAVAAVYSGRAKLPVEDDMRSEYRERVAKKGVGKAFHSLKGQDIEYANSLVEWINGDSDSESGHAVEGHTYAWCEAFAAFHKKLERRSGAK